MRKTKYTKDVLESLAKSLFSIGSILDKLGLKRTGGNYRNINSKIRFYGIDTSHFLGKGWSKGKTAETDSIIYKMSKKIETPIEEIFCENSRYIYGEKIIRKLVENYKKEYRCEICKKSEWMNKPLKLQLDHINGIHSDNRVENLRIICPNCHSQTETFCGKNKKRKKKQSKCSMCNAINSYQSKSGLCKKCYDKTKTVPRKVNRPSASQLENEINSIGYLATGRKYGVSDNSIRKWAKSYGIL